MEKGAKVFIGTSGWSYKHWGERFYPKDIPQAEHLQYYASHFPTVEINATFYRLPSESMVQGWHRKAPPGFIYAVKGSRLITHYKRLQDVQDPLHNFIERISELKNHLGPILWQLPPNFKKDISRLKSFFKELPKKYDHAVEFRHPSWIDDEVFDLLRDYQIAQVWLSSLRMPVNFTVTSDFVYMRLHGLEGGFSHDYTESELEPWAKRIRKAAESEKPVFVYFNNDANARAPDNAKKLMNMVEPYAVPAFLEEEEYETCSG